jgi:hypothetical protein
MSILARPIGHVFLWLAIGISWAVSLPIVLAIAFVGGTFCLVRCATLRIVHGPHAAAREEAARLSGQREDALYRATAAYVEDLIDPLPNSDALARIGRSFSGSALSGLAHAKWRRLLGSEAP